MDQIIGLAVQCVRFGALKFRERKFNFGDKVILINCHMHDMHAYARSGTIVHAPARTCPCVQTPHAHMHII